MSLTGALDVLTDGERARHPGHLGTHAYFDGWSQASGGPARTFPRFLTRDEEECWRDGWKEAKAEHAEWGIPNGWPRVITPGPPVLQLAPRRSECRTCPVLAVAA